MKIHVLAFGATRELIGKNSFDLELPQAATIKEVRAQLSGQYPQFEKLTAIAFAVNSEYENEDFLLKDGDELALIPPVSGG